LTAVQEIMEKVFHLPSGRLQSGSGEQSDGDADRTNTG
jgi:hypothetical protein